MSFPDREQQILTVHAGLIRMVVEACGKPGMRPQIEALLREAEQQGWSRLVEVIRKILDGRRDQTVILGMDEEDSVILRAILSGLENPATLPPLQTAPDPAQAAPGLALMIHAAGKGDAQAMQALANMAEQMLKAGGDMARLGGNLRRLVNGETDADLLTKGMGPLGRTLVLSILEELGRLRAH
jgi:hypothetical protein